MKTKLLALGFSAICTIYPASAQISPSYAIRHQTLRSLVQVNASGCPDNTRRVGTGFVLSSSRQIVTAHHVVGGCTSIRVSYEAIPPTDNKSRVATITRVLAAGDLALLSVASPPSVPALQLASSLNTAHEFAGFGYQHGLPTAGDQDIKLSVGSSRLSDILPDRGASLQRGGSRVNLSRQIVRFGAALQPGMSGGPIIDPNGRVVAIVAGGLKSGASTASWGWPASWVGDLLNSTDSINLAVRVSGLYYTREEMGEVVAAERNAEQLRCGALTFTFQGQKRFAEIYETADDIPRIEHIRSLSRMDAQTLDDLRFDLWVHRSSGATAVVPSGYVLSDTGIGCTASSRGGPFELALWGAPARSPVEVQAQSQAFESTMLIPRVPAYIQFGIDPQLTTFQHNIPGPQVRRDGLVFNRKGFIYALQTGGSAHIFSTLVARSGTFLGVATLNSRSDPHLGICFSNEAMLSHPDCQQARRHANEWTHFVLATQLSTYPSI